MTLQLSRVIGHRGACGYAPENTLASMSKAYELGARWVEFDVMLAQCGEAIIIHDTTLDRTTNSVGEVAETTYEKMADLDSGSWFSPDYAGAKIPTLKELLNHVASLNMGINVEIKSYPGHEITTVRKTLDILSRHWPSDCLPPLVSSLSPLVLEAVRSMNPNIFLGLIIDTWDSNWEYILDHYNCISLHADHTLLNPSRVARMKDSGRLILGYTVNEVKRAKDLFQWGIDALFTDYPDLILSA